MHHLRSQRSALSILLVLILCLAGCSSNDVINNLDLAVEAVTAAFPLVAATAGLPPAVATQVEGYLSLSATAISKAADILAGPGTDAQKAALITGAFAGIATPAVPAQYQGVATAVQAVANLVAKFLAGATATADPGPVVAKQSFLPAPAATKGTSKLSAKDHKKLAAIKEKAEAAKKSTKGH